MWVTSRRHCRLGLTVEVDEAQPYETMHLLTSDAPGTSSCCQWLCLDVWASSCSLPRLRISMALTPDWDAARARIWGKPPGC